MQCPDLCGRLLSIELPVELQFAGEALMQSHKESRVPDPSAITHLQVLEVAAAEIDYRVAEAETYASANQLC